MSKLLGLGSVRRVAIGDTRAGAEDNSSDEEGGGVMGGNNDSMEMEEALYATVFDGEDGIGGIAARVSRRRSSARMSSGSALTVTPGKDGATPRKKATSSVKKIRVIKEDKSSSDRADKENETDVNSRRKSSSDGKSRRSTEGIAASPLRTISVLSNEKEDKKASSSSSRGTYNRSNGENTVHSDVREVAPVVEEEPSHPWSIEDFSVGKSIGRGKFGNVYSARQKMPKDRNGKRIPGTGAQVALKVLFKAPMVAAKCIHNLRREVEIQSRLKHPNIVQLYGYFDDAKSVYLILQYINGGEVYKHVRRNTSEGRVEEWLCRTMVHDVMSALAYMHARHVYHRDLKAENLLLCYQEKDGEETVKVCLGDFGWAVHAPPPNSTRYTMCGTPEYLSPEMLSGGGHEHHVDLWSCGVLMFELLTGTTPFVHEDESEAGTDVTWGDGSESHNEQAKVFSRISKHSFGAIDVDAAYGTTHEAAGFINALLHPVPSERPEAAHALEHPWMKLERIRRS